MEKFEKILESLVNEVANRLQEYKNGNDDVWNMEDDDLSFTEIEFDTDILDYVSEGWLFDYIFMVCDGLDKADDWLYITDEDTLMIYIDE